MTGLPHALQLYSIRDHLERDLAGTLKGLRGAGFEFVELAGTYGLGADAFKQHLDDAGLTAISAHVPFDLAVRQTASVIRDAHTLGAAYVVIPWLHFESEEEWREAAAKMAAAGAEFRAAGLPLCYHNHEHEFQQRFGGVSVFDLIFRETPSECLAIELDCGWARVGGADPAEILEEYGARVPLVHIKDWKPGADGAPVLTEIGKGIMEWGPILEAARKAGVQWFIAEQDDSDTDSLASARENAAFLAAQPR